MCHHSARHVSVHVHLLVHPSKRGLTAAFWARLVCREADVTRWCRQSFVDQLFIFADGKAAVLDVKCVTTMWHLKYTINNMVKSKVRQAN